MQTPEGAIKQRKTIVDKYGENYWRNLGLQGAEVYRQRQRDGIAKPRGFAAMSPERLLEISKKGGRHAK